MSNLESMGAMNALAGTTGLGLPAAIAAASSRLSTGIDIQSYTAAGTYTWTKPANAKYVAVFLCGSGSGGGSGRRDAATFARVGGGGGAGGSMSFGFIRASDLPATVNVTVGAGGAGGAAVTVNATSGANGSVGGDTYFGASAAASYINVFQSNAGGGAGQSGAGGAGGTSGT